MVKNFLDYYNAVNKRKRKTNEEKEYTKHLQYVKNKSYSENKDQYDEVRKNLGYQPDDKLTKRKYDTYVGNEKTGDTGISGRFEQYYKEHPDRKPVQQELNKPFKSSKELKVNNNQEKANTPSSFDEKVDKGLNGLGKFINDIKNSKVVQKAEELGNTTVGKAYKKVAEEVFQHSPLGQKVENVKVMNKAMPYVDQYGGAASTRNVLSTIKDGKDQSTKDIVNDIKGGFTGKKKTSGEDLAKQWGNDSKYGSKLEGLGIEAVADPTNLIGVGIGSKVLKSASKLSKMGKITEEGIKAAELTKITEKLNKTGKVSKSDSKKLLQDIQSKQLKEIEAKKVADEEVNRLNPVSYPKNFEGLYHIKDEYPMDVKAMLSRENQAIKNGSVSEPILKNPVENIQPETIHQQELNQPKLMKIPEVQASVKEPTHTNIDAAPGLNPIKAPLMKVANVESKPLPSEYDAVKHISEQISDNVKPEKHPIMQRLKELGNRVYYNMVDDRHGIGRLDKAAKKNVDDYDSAIALSHQAAGSGSKATQALEKGIYNTKGEKVGEGFKGILQQAKDPEKLQQYLVAKSSLDYDSKGMTAFDSKGFNQKEISTAAIEKLEKEHPGIKEEANRVYKFIEQQQQVLKDGGLLNDEQIAQMKKDNPNYVGMQRLQDDGIESFTKGNESLKKRLMNVGKPTNKRTGSKKQIINPLETIVKRQYVYQNMADRNKPGIAILNHLRSMPEDNIFGNIVDVEKNANYKLLEQADEVANHSEDEINNGINDLFREKDGNNNILYVYENGDKYKIQVKDKLLFDSIMSMDSKSLPVWMKAINAPVKMLRAGITLSPDFGLRNVIRDQLTTAISSKRGYIPGLDALKGAAEIIKGRKGNSSLLHAYIKNGGDMSVLQNIDRTNVIKTYQDLQGNKPLMSKLKEVAKDPSKLLEPLRKIGEFSEQSTRIGHMKKSIKKGSSPEQAAYDARSTMDFNRAGAWGRQINQVAAFFNASVQGLDITARSMVKRPLKTSLAIGGYIVAPTIALYKLNQDQQWFKDLPPDERDRNWFMKLPGEDGQIIKIPKPFEVGILFGAGTERALDKGDHSFDGYLKEVYDTMTPDVLPTVLKPWLEVMTNHNLFTGQSIESMGDQYLPAEERKTAYNSQIANKTSEILSKLNKRNEVSPKDVDHLIRGYTGTLGSYGTEGIDMILGALNSKIPEKPSRGVQTMPFIRSFVQRNLEGNNKPTNDFYQLHDDLQRMSKKEGFQYESQRKRVNSIFYKMNKLQSAKKDILNDNQINGKDKAQQIKELNKIITEMARKANEEYKIKR